MLKVLISVLLLVCLVSVADSQANRKGHPRELGLSQDPGRQQYLFVNGVRFSSPRGFNVRRARITNELIYIPHAEYDLGIFVAAPNAEVDNASIERMSALLASYLLPVEKATYSWKKIAAGYEKVSKFETGGGLVQGFNGQQRVMVHYRMVKVKRRQIVAGYIFGLDRGDEAKQLFEQNLGGDSMPGWYAQAHILASLTGEKYTQINPGTELIAMVEPAPPKEVASSGTTEKPLDLGELEGVNYVNRFFGLSLSVPRDWLVASAQNREHLGENLKKLVNADDPSKRAQVDASIDRSTTLLALMKVPPGQPNNASLMMIAERIPSPAIKNGTDVLLSMKNAISGTNITVEFQDDIITEQIAGSEFSAVTTRNTSPYGNYQQRIYVTVKNGYALQLFLTYLDEADLAAFEAVIKSIKPI